MIHRLLTSTNYTFNVLINKPILQHHTPKVHLQNFVDADGFVHVLKKDASYRLKPDKAARERNFNEYKLGKEASNYQFEDFLARLESNAAPLYLKLQMGTPLTMNDRIHWSLYVSSMFLRSRKMRDDFAIKMAKEMFARNVEADDVLRDVQYELLKNGRLVPIDELRRVAREQTTLMLSQPAYLHLRDFAERVPRFAFPIFNATWTVSRTERGNLITSDTPVCTAQITREQIYLGYGLARENTVVFMPLSPTMLFVSGDPSSTRFAPVIPEESVSLINKCMAQFAGQEVYSNHFSKDLKLLVEKNIDTLVFGRDAFRDTSFRA